MSKQPKPVVVEVVIRCGICKHENGDHALSCPTRWYGKPS